MGPLSMEFSRQEYWSGLPYLSAGHLLHWQEDSLPAEPQGKLKNTGVGSLSLLQWIFPTQESNWVPCITGRFFTSWATREDLSEMEILGLGYIR